METKFQTSFIPKAPVTESLSRRSSGTGFLFLIAFILFIASAASAGGVYFYAQILDKKIEEGNKELTANKNIFNPNEVQDLSRLNDRINAAYTLLQNHVALTDLFDVIGQVTLQNVQFTNFSYSNSGGDKISLNMNGKANSYETVALQARALTDPSMKFKNAFKSPILGDISTDRQGNRSFSLSSGIDSKVVSYYRLIKDLKKANILDSYININNSQPENVDNAGGSEVMNNNSNSEQ